MTSLSSPIHVYIPPELLGQIFSHCDPPTLSILTRSSFAFLQLSSSFLYKHVHINDAEILRLLFCTSLPPKRSSSTRHLPHLSLSQINIFTWTPTPSPPTPPHLSHSRLPNSSPLQVHRLTLLILHDPHQTEEIALDVLSFFDPTHFHLDGSSFLLKTQHLPFFSISNVEWNRLSSVTFTNAISEDDLYALPFLETARSDGPELTIIFDMMAGAEGVVRLQDDLLESVGYLVEESPEVLEWVKVVGRVDSEEAAENLREELRVLWAEAGFEGELLKRVVVVVEVKPGYTVVEEGTGGALEKALEEEEGKEKDLQ